MFEIDFARGFAYNGKYGYILEVCLKGLYVKIGNKEIILTDKNSKILEEDKMYEKN